MGGVKFVAGDTTGPTRTTHCPIDALQRARVRSDAAGRFEDAEEGRVKSPVGGSGRPELSDRRRSGFGEIDVGSDAASGSRAREDQSVMVKWLTQ